jgi:hypothetical protein
MDDLDELERELGTSLRLALGRAAAAITDERRPEPPSVDRYRPAPATEVTVIDFVPAPHDVVRHPRWLVTAAVAAAIALVLGSLFVWAATDDAAETVPAGPDVTSTTVSTILTGDASTVIGHWSRPHVGWVLLYGDGRVIWSQDLGFAIDPLGVPGVPYERRLSAQGLELLRSGQFQLSGVIGRGTSAVPDSVWTGPRAKPYEATTYAICSAVPNPITGTPALLADAEVMARLPASAQAILGGAAQATSSPFSPLDDQSPAPGGCPEVTRDQANALVAILNDPAVGSGTVVYDSSARDPALIVFNDVWLQFAPVLPDGHWVATGG